MTASTHSLTGRKLVVALLLLATYFFGIGVAAQRPNHHTILGSPRVVITAVAVSLLLAGAVAWRGSRALLLGVGALSVGVGLFDGRAVAQAVQDTQVGGALIAAIAGLLHLWVAVLAGRLGWPDRWLRRVPRTSLH